MYLQLNRRSLTLIFSGVSIVLLVVAGLVWWNFVYQSPSRVFEGMLQNNLQTSSVTKHQISTTNGQSAEQYLRLQLGGTNASQWLVTLKQAGSNVTTESIGTPSAGYIRYVHLATSQTQTNGKPYNFSSILGVWGKTDVKSGGPQAQLFSQSLLDVGTAPIPPIGNLSPDNQQNVLQFMHDQAIFTPDYSTMQRTTLDGRRVYVYSVSVKLAPYLRMMQAFAHDNGLKDLDNINPSDYQTVPPVTLVFMVDTLSHQLRKVSYEAAKFTESYSDYGLTSSIVIPTKTIPVTELQTRLQKLY
jgi:hypothetical protein